MTQGPDAQDEFFPQDQGQSSSSDSPTVSKKPVNIYDWRNDEGLTDSLNNQTDRPIICAGSRCLGSKMNTAAANKPLTLDTAIAQAKDFLKQYYADASNHDKPDKSLEDRQAEVLAELRQRRTYEMTKDELTWGARTAWRNAPRCPGRVVWKKLHVFDQRHVDDTDRMFKAILDHIDYSNNGGNIRPAITLFRQRHP